jgi:hypothetical protein
VRSPSELAIALLEASHSILTNNIRAVTLEEALGAAGGYRSVLGILKHTVGWSHVYHSYAFDAAPRHWAAQDFPRGLRDTIETTQEYVDAIREWYEQSWEAWKSSLSTVADEDFDAPRRCHWGATAPLFDIVVMVATHWTYHAGELNEILAIVRTEAWEYSEEVEENHISTAGHRLRPGWMSPEQVTRYEAYLAMRDAQLHGPPPDARG